MGAAVRPKYTAGGKIEVVPDHMYGPGEFGVVFAPNAFVVGLLDNENSADVFDTHPTHMSVQQLACIIKRHVELYGNEELMRCLGP